MTIGTGLQKDPPSGKRIKVMIVDDSAVIRAVITRTLQENPDIEVVGTAFNGEVAVRNIKTFQPDIVLLDIEMPVMDGITALPLLLKEKPGTRIIICSTLSARGADISIKALSLGATECLLKPGGDSISTADDFKKSLLTLIRSLAPVQKEASVSTPQKKGLSLNTAKQALPPQILAIGSSTGGPHALMEVLKNIQTLSVPVVITQHMPKTFTAILAQHIEQACKIPCFEGAEGMPLKRGCIYIAPGGYHMILKKSGVDTIIHLDEGPLENYCRPSVNPMLRSLMTIYGNRILAVILTGMGNDGSQACGELVAQGGQVIAQDEATSVVWGMPAAVAQAGICSAILPLGDIGKWINNAIR